MTLARRATGADAPWHVMLDRTTTLCGLTLPQKRMPPAGEQVALAAICRKCKRLRER